MSHHVSPLRGQEVLGGLNYHDVTEGVLRPLENKPAKLWMLAMMISMTALGIGLFCIGYAIWYGIGTWGLNKTVGWAFDITDFVFWVGIGHAGTLISAILLLFRQTWRNSINRAAEAMTIFAVICAAIFPMIHMGRPWLGAFWVFPLPNTRGPLWVNFNSPLLWDVFAISTYFSVSLVFWYLGLVPDFASVRDRAKNKIAKMVYGGLSLGWNGSAKTWYRFELVSLILAGVSTPLVLSVHTIVSMDFATSVIPGWHTTIFPPYFVAGAIFSGFGMVQTLLVVTRKVYKLENMITMNHMEAMAKIVILTGSLVGIAYGTEFFIAWYSGNHFESFAFVNRAFGPYWWSYWIMISCNVISPQLFWIKKIRTSMLATFILSIFVNIGMWFERFVIIVTSLHRDYLPSSWAMYTPTWIEIGTFVGTFGIFFTFFFAFAKFFPVVNMFEVKTLIHIPHNQQDEH
ncbi:MAG: polysulfide reductase NrfD [Bacteroidetes bacterium]|jgi:molybdopterin-containing oxidoreductase family membrane subunit|nr:polysulfide reductase NrfD [Bacteroidota bacterium]MBL0015829.1 polysulfide reductase NrfD [Bacteroidota bacterium]MBP6638773.1 polysulfide reductase NrfD [Bacteroidia bacterium]MBP6720719.1 polysulfide reductase NrfD [Bacteroidia bacterium]